MKIQGNTVGTTLQPKAALVKSENLTEEEKAIARENIGAVASVNGIAPDKTGNVEIETGGGSVEGAVLYTEQTLTASQQSQSRANIGAVSAAEVEILIDSKLSVITNAEEVAY